MAKLVVVEGPNRGAVIELPEPGPARIGRDPSAEIDLPDEEISRSHARLERQGERWVVRDLGSRNGTLLNGVRLEGDYTLAHGDELGVGATLLVFLLETEAAPAVAETGSTVVRDLRSPLALPPAEPRVRRRETRDRGRARTLVGNGPAMRKVSALVARCAPLDTTVLVLGESGTGKELVADALHRLGPRRDGPFVAINCATLEPALLESELFGHERGAFTGAVARKLGKLELARGGTLFLDEVAELPLAAQAKLLRALEERKFQRVGGYEDLSLEARVVAATNQDLAALVAEKKFREDLVFRLKVVEIVLPPLRDRLDDLPALVTHFVGELRPRIGSRATGFSKAALERLAAHRFPGNVRELRNLIERCLIFADGALIEESDLPAEVGGRAAAAPSATTFPTDLTLADVERLHIGRVLEAEQWNKTKVAKLLGIDRQTLYAKIKKYGLTEPPSPS